MVFLNAPEGGGQTEFPRPGSRSRRGAGNLLAWNNLDALGEPNHASLHRAARSPPGVKYVITKWYRERPWIFTDAPHLLTLRRALGTREISLRATQRHCRHCLAVLCRPYTIHEESRR